MSRVRRVWLLILTAVVLAGCGGAAVSTMSPSVQNQAVPAAASYGHGAWAFSVSFLAMPTNTGVRRAVGTPGVVARDTYQAHFKNGVGVGTQKLVIIELPHLPGGRCILRSLLPVVGPCPKPHGDVLLRGVNRCSEGFCHGYSGAIIILKGKMSYYLQAIGTGQATASAVLDSFSPRA